MDAVVLLNGRGSCAEHARLRTERKADMFGSFTDHQRSLVAVAIDRSYYHTPRECSLTELAGAVGLAKSTTSETLHRAKRRVMKEFVETADEGRLSSTTE